VDSGRQRISWARRARSPPRARSEVARDACRRLGDRGDEALRRPARHDPLGVADHAYRADRVPAVVEDRRCDVRFAADRLVALARDAALADALELRAQLARAQHPAGQPRQRLRGQVVDGRGREIGQNRLPERARVNRQLRAESTASSAG
jgi:hypothetical protein